jgi:hypothetical protein
VLHLPTGKRRRADEVADGYVEEVLARLIREIRAGACSPDDLKIEFDAAPKGKFIIGEFYYRCHVLHFHDKARPIFQTWIYNGLRKLNGSSSSSCDKPYHFYHFSLHCGGYGGSLGGYDGAPPVSDLNIPSLGQASESLLTWDELLASLDDVKEQLAEDADDTDMI